MEKLLEQQVIRRSLHREWIYHGLDGAMAARALAARGATGSAPVLIEAFRRIDPELKKLDNPQWAQYPLAWADFHFKMHLLPALGGSRHGHPCLIGPTAPGPDSGIESGGAVGAGVAASQTKLKFKESQVTAARWQRMTGPHGTAVLAAT
jgi:hypothetical protein